MWSVMNRPDPPRRLGGVRPTRPFGSDGDGSETAPTSSAPCSKTGASSSAGRSITRGSASSPSSSSVSATGNESASASVDESPRPGSRRSGGGGGGRKLDPCSGSGCSGGGGGRKLAPSSGSGSSGGGGGRKAGTGSAWGSTGDMAFQFEDGSCSTASPGSGACQVVASSPCCSPGAGWAHWSGSATSAACQPGDSD